MPSNKSPSIFNHYINLEIKRRLELNYSQEDIAKWIGCSRSLLSVHLRNIREEYDIPYVYKKYKVKSYSEHLPKDTSSPLYAQWVSTKGERYYFKEN